MLEVIQVSANNLKHLIATSKKSQLLKIRWQNFPTYNENGVVLKVKANKY